MDFQLSEELRAIQRMARKFAKKEIAPVVDADEKAHRFPREIIQKMAELGFFGCVIPEEYGGCSIGYLSHVLIVERYYREAKLYQIIEGSSNILKMIIAQDALNIRKANR